MKKKWKLKVIGLLLIGLFLVGAASCEIRFLSYIRIINSSGNNYSIDAVYIRPNGAISWGTNQIYPDSIAVGSAVSFEVDSGWWDVEVWDSGLPSFGADTTVLYPTGVFVPEGRTISLYFYESSDDLSQL